jgi:hypothetical protein
LNTRNRKMLVASTLLVLIIIASVVIGSFLALQDQERGGMQARSILHDSDPLGGQYGYRLNSVDANGTVLALESKESGAFQYDNHSAYFIALDQNGTMKWKTGTNSQVDPALGADGKYYYIDWPASPVRESNSSMSAWYNLTALDKNGKFDWDLLMNGDIGILAVYSDGTVIVHHTLVEFDPAANTTVYRTNEILSINGNGSVVWRMDQKGYDYSFGNPRVAENGTLLANTNTANGSYEIGIKKDGSQMYVVKVQYYTGLRFPNSSINGTTMYQVTEVYNDNGTTVTNVSAIDLSNGREVWSTVLGYFGNPSNLSHGVWKADGALLDSYGEIYCRDLEGKHSYALSPEGNIIWKGPYHEAMWATFPSGGVLVSDGAVLERIAPDGSTSWKYDTGNPNLMTSNVLLSYDGTIYYSSGNGLFALSHTSALSNGQITILLIAVLDVAALFIFFLVIRKGEKRRAIDIEKDEP